MDTAWIKYINKPNWGITLIVHGCVCVRACVRVCVCERERERVHFHLCVKWRTVFVVFCSRLCGSLPTLECVWPWICKWAQEDIPIGRGQKELLEYCAAASDPWKEELHDPHWRSIVKNYCFVSAVKFYRCFFVALSFAVFTVVITLMDSPF